MTDTALTMAVRKPEHDLCMRVYKKCSSVDTKRAQAWAAPRNGLFCTSHFPPRAEGIYKLVHSLCMPSATRASLVHILTQLVHT